MFNISQSTHSKDPNFRIHMDMLTNFRQSRKKNSVGAPREEIFQFNCRIDPQNNEL